MDTDLSNRSSRNKISNMACLPSASGRSTNSLLGSLLKQAASRAYGLLVAPITTRFELSTSHIPSHWLISSLKMSILEDLTEAVSLDSISESISSKKITDGASFLASVNTA